MAVQAAVLFTGGLDGLLVVEMLREQNVELQGLFVELPSGCQRRDPRPAADAVKLPLTVVPADDDFFARFARPPRLAHLPPDHCAACRVQVLTAGRRFMEQIGADFTATGEVLGQRPTERSRLALASAAQQAGLHDRVLRPLSARLLPETAVERSGKIDRARLLAWEGRGRQEQLALAQRLGISEPPAPCMECPLRTSPMMGRVQRLLKRGSLTAWDFELLPVGRKVDLPSGAQLTLGRRSEENAQLSALFQHPGAPPCVLLSAVDFTGPTGLWLPGLDDSLAASACPSSARAAIEEIVRYGKPGPVGGSVLWTPHPGHASSPSETLPLASSG